MCKKFNLKKIRQLKGDRPENIRSRKIVIKKPFSHLVFKNHDSKNKS